MPNYVGLAMPGVANAQKHWPRGVARSGVGHRTIFSSFPHIKHLRNKARTATLAVGIVVGTLLTYN